jgi:hypothetical protein
MAHAGERKTPQEYALLDDLGTVWIRRTFSWDAIEKEPEQWDFAEFDAYVDQGRAAGKKILAVLAYDADWIHRGEKYCPGIHVSAEQLPYYLRYVETVVRRYRDRVDAFEIWNEPNNRFMFWKGSREEFFALAGAAVRKIKEIDPSIKVLAGSFWLSPASYIRAMFRSGALDRADALSFHPYAASPRGTLRSYRRLKKLCAEFGFAGEIWITEVGYATRGIYPGFINENNYPEYIVKTLTGLAARDPRTIFWYELFDRDNRGQERSAWNPEYYFGLVYPDYSPKRGAAAFGLCARTLAGAEYRPGLPPGLELPRRITAFYFRGREGGGILILWKDGGTRRVRLSPPGAGALLHDFESGGAAAFSGGELTLGSMPRMLTWTDARD